MSSSRPTRRAAAKAIDYSLEQQFSDAEDIFEDGEAEEVVKPKKASARKPRKSSGARRSTGGGDGGMVRELEPASQTDEGDYQAPRIVYTEKGYDPSLPPIRERFDFMPEYEADGSPRIELIVGRRPVDEQGNNDNEGEDDDEDEDGNPKSKGKDDDDSEDDDDSDSDDSGARRRKKKTKKASSSPTKNGQDAAAASSGVVEYEYLVKYKGRSYLHLEWKTGADLESMNKSAKTLYRRYLKKIEQGIDDELENPDFDPSFAVPQKIIDEGEQEIELELTDKELIKWEKEREKALAEEEGTDDDNMKIDGDDKDEEKKSGDDKDDGEEKKGERGIF